MVVSATIEKPMEKSYWYLAEGTRVMKFTVKITLLTANAFNFLFLLWWTMTQTCFWKVSCWTDWSPRAGGLCYTWVRSSCPRSVGSGRASVGNSRLSVYAPPRTCARAPLGYAARGPAVCAARSHTAAACGWCLAAPPPAQTPRVASSVRPVRASVGERPRSWGTEWGHIHRPCLGEQTERVL